MIVEPYYYLKRSPGEYRLGTSQLIPTHPILSLNIEYLLPVLFYRRLIYSILFRVDPPK